MKIQIPGDQVEYWKTCAKNGVLKIDKRREAMLESFNIKKAKRGWWERFNTEKWRDNHELALIEYYEDDVFDTCVNFLIMIEKPPVTIYLTHKEVLALKRWE